MKRRIAACLVAAALAWPAASPAQTSGPFKLVLGYDGVLVVKVLDMQIEQVVTDDAFAASARMKSYGVLSLFKRLDVRADSRGRLDGGVIRPARFNHTNRDGSLNRAVEVRWSASDVTASALPAYPTPGDPAPTLRQKLSASDPLTLMIRLALTAPGQKPCTGAAQVFDGRQLYALEFSAPAAREANARERAANLVTPVRCKLTFTEVAGFDRKPAHRRNQGLSGPLAIDFARVGPDGPWVVSAVTGRTPLGEAVIQLKSVRAETRGVQVVSLER